jgi:hypothetical protein
VGPLLLADTIRFEFDYRFDSLIFGFSRKYPLSNRVSYSTYAEAGDRSQSQYPVFFPVRRSSP